MERQVMPDDTSTLLPLKFNFQPASEDTRFYIYSIWNTLKDKYYIGISQHPNDRLKQSLGLGQKHDKPNKKRKELHDDFKCAAEQHGQLPTEEFPIKFGILNKDGYPNAFLGCVAEVLHMIELEKSGKHLYNQNKFGGHVALGDQRVAFETVVKIMDPALQGHPSDNQMRELETHIHTIKNFIAETNGAHIINQDFLDELEEAWDEYVTRQKNTGFGRNNTMPSIAFGEEYLPLIPVPSNDNMPDEYIPKKDKLCTTPDDQTDNNETYSL